MNVAYSHSFDSSKYDFSNNSFEEEKDTARPIFYMDEVVDPATQEIQRVEMIKIQSPGENLCVYGGKVREQDRLRFAKAYDAFKRGETTTDGTPLSKWPSVASNVDFLSQLRAFGFQTVEDMANMADSAQRLFHGSLTWKRKAQIFLSENKKVEAAKAKDAELEDLRAQLAEIKAALAENAAKPGRKPKVVQA